MKYRTLRVLALLLLTTLIATPVFAAGYSATLTVSETGTGSHTMVGITADIDNQGLMDDSLITATGLDTRVLLGTSELPHMLASDRVTFALPIEENNQYPLEYTTGNDDLTSFDIVPGDGGYVTAKDHANLEPSDNFSIESVMWIGKSQTLLSKTGALALSDNGSGDVTFNILGASVWVSPTNATGAGWTNPSYAYDGHTSTYASYSITGTSGYLTLTVPTDDYDRLQFYWPGHSGITNYWEVEWDSSWHTVYSSATGAYTGWVNVPFGGYHSVSQIRYKGHRSTAGIVVVNEVDIGNVSGTALTVTASGVDEGLRTVKVYADTVNLAIDIDGINEDSAALSGGSVPDSSSDWVLYPDPYWSYYSHAVSGVEVLRYQPVLMILGEEYSTGTVTVTNGDETVTGAGGAAWTDSMAGGVFVSTDGVHYVIDSITDGTHLELATVYGGATLGGQSYDMYPRIPDEIGSLDGALTWGSNPAGITVELGALLPSTDSQASVDAQGDDSSFVPETGDSDMTTSGVEGENLPFYGLIKGLLTSYNELGGPNIPMADFWKLAAVVIGWCFGTMIMIVTRNVIFGAIAYVLGFSVPAFSMGGMLDTWIPIVYGISALCLAGLIWKWTSSSIG